MLAAHILWPSKSLAFGISTSRVDALKPDQDASYRVTASLACHVGKRPQRRGSDWSRLFIGCATGNSNTRPLLPSVTVGFRSNPYSFPGNRMLDSDRPEQSLTVHLVTGGARLCSIL